MVDPTPEALRAAEAKLPTFKECHAACAFGGGTALQRFIYDHEPPGQVHREWRNSLVAVLAERDAALSAQAEESKGLREALEWYAEQAAGCRKIGSAGDPFREALDADGGKRARAALAATPPAPVDEAAGLEREEALCAAFWDASHRQMGTQWRHASSWAGPSMTERNYVRQGVRALLRALAAEPGVPGGAAEGRGKK